MKLKLRTGTGLSRAEMIMRQQKEREEAQRLRKELKRKEEEERRIVAGKKAELARKKAKEEAERVAQKQREEAARREAQRAREESARRQAKLEEEANARRLAQIEEERRAQLEAERKTRLEQEETARRQAELQRQQAALAEQPRQSGGRQLGVGLPSQQNSHPERFLNQLSPQDQALFLERFSVLNLDQQTYAYNQFLSTPPDIQKFAISQFLSLEPEVLIVSIQAEIEREAALVAEASSPQFQRGVSRQQQQQASFQAASRAVPAQPLRSSRPAPPVRLARRRSDSDDVEGPSPEELRAIRQQLSQQAEARKTLKQIIDRQTEVNRRHLMGSVAQ